MLKLSILCVTPSLRNSNSQSEYLPPANWHGQRLDNIFVVSGLVSKELVTIFPCGYKIYNVPLLFQ